MHGLIDLDYIKWQASAVGQKNTIKCIHKQSGDELSFKTRTDFHGRNKDKNGGWIGEQKLFFNYRVYSLTENTGKLLHYTWLLEKKKGAENAK